LPEIRFSHRYLKLERGVVYRKPVKRAILLEVFLAERDELHKDFVEYDTAYWKFYKKDSWGIWNEVSYYQLPKGKVIVLLFKATNNGNFLFTTIRRYTPKKYEYYKKMRGKEFEVVIEEKEGVK